MLFAFLLFLGVGGGAHDQNKLNTYKETHLTRIEILNGATTPGQ